MKKILICLLLFVFCTTMCSCNNEEQNFVSIPPKNDSDGTSIFASSVNTNNLDQYMFRTDVQYVDLRNPDMILREGYIAGFQFISFYSIIASFTSNDVLYKMEHVYTDESNRIPAGQVGGFVPLYKESEKIIKSLFSIDKYIFLVSQGGSESSYMINLLVQLGYDAEKLYNVGGVMNSEGLPSYSSISTNRYFVEGHGNLELVLKYEFINDLTPIIYE